MIHPSDLQPGTEIGGYRIERKIGVGGMGAVYLATQLSMDRQVALKILYGASTRQEEGLQDFIREARLLAKLDHPNIVTAFDFGEQDGIYYLAMAYVEGEDLADRLTRSGPVPENEALVVAKKVAEALRYAWEKHQMLHRDVNPANIMIDRFGDVRIMDLGISKNLGEETADSDTLEGTPNYMSPEQASGSNNLDFRSDMYSLGATLYAMVTGVIPFDEEDPLATIRRVLKEPLEPAHKANPDVTGPMSTLIQVMMGKATGDRFDSWTACVRKMDQILEGEPVTKPAPGKVVSRRSEGSAKKPSRKVVAQATGGAHKLNVPGAHSAKKQSGGLVFGVIILALAAAAGWWFGVYVPREKAAEAKRIEAANNAAKEAERLEALNDRFRTIQLLVKKRPPKYTQFLTAMSELREDAAGTDLIVSIDQQVAIVKEKMGKPEPGDHGNPSNGGGEVKPPEVVVDVAAQNRAFKQLSDDVGAGVLRQDFKQVRKLLQNAELEQWNSHMQTTITLWKDSLRVLERFGVDLRISLLADRGNEVLLDLAEGPERLVIKGIRGDEIHAGVILTNNGKVLGVLPRTIQIDDLSETERLSRLGSGHKEVAILKALWAMERNDMKAVQAALDGCDLPLSRAIRVHVPQASIPPATGGDEDNS